MVKVPNRSTRDRSSLTIYAIFCLSTDVQSASVQGKSSINGIQTGIADALSAIDGTLNGFDVASTAINRTSTVIDVT